MPHERRPLGPSSVDGCQTSRRKEKDHFPLQIAVTLSPRKTTGSPGYEGGAFVLSDAGVGRKSLRRELALDEGDAVVFCTRHRPVRVAGTPALQPVYHGMAPLTAGDRYVLGCPFHDYR